MVADLAAGKPAQRPAMQLPHPPEHSPADAVLPAIVQADLQLVLHADALSVRHVLRVVQLRLGVALSDAAAGSLELVLAEILNNIVEHAYHGAGGRIDLRIGAEPGALACRVTDQGAPMPEGKLPDQPCPDTGLAIGDLPEGGFGWMMIRELAQDLQYRRDAGRNELRFRLTRE